LPPSGPGLIALGPNRPSKQSFCQPVKRGSSGRLWLKMFDGSHRFVSRSHFSSQNGGDSVLRGRERPTDMGIIRFGWLSLTGAFMLHMVLLYLPAMRSGAVDHQREHWKGAILCVKKCPDSGASISCDRRGQHSHRTPFRWSTYTEKKTWGRG